MDPVETAQQLADELLFPTALANDAAGAIPIANFCRPSSAPLYETSIPHDFELTCAMFEAFS